VITKLVQTLTNNSLTHSLRIGSDEDEDEADESRSMEDPSETAVSRDNKLEHTRPVQDFLEAEQIEEGRVVLEVKLEEQDDEEKDADTQQTETSEADGTVTGGTSPEKKNDTSREEAKQVGIVLNMDISNMVVGRPVCTQ